MAEKPSSHWPPLTGVPAQILNGAGEVLPTLPRLTSRTNTICKKKKCILTVHSFDKAAKDIRNEKRSEQQIKTAINKT